MHREPEVMTHDDDHDDNTEWLQCKAANICSKNVQITIKSPVTMKLVDSILKVAFPTC